MSTVAKKVIMGSGAVGEVDVIEQSLLFNDDAAHLKRTPGSAGNRRTWTLSFWAKNLMAADGGSFFGVDVGSFYFEIEVGAIKFAWYSGSWQIKLVPIVLLRDPASWYHILLAVDTTQSTSTNRVKFYFNGVQITSFDNDNNTFPSQNLETPMNGAYEHFIGATRANERSANSYLAEMHLLDGAVKAPSDFIETNSDTGQLVPKEYEGGSYGTNGFYLKFASGALATDSSGEGNNYTAVNLANADVVPDTPTNNFTTINPLVPTSSTFSEGNLKATMGNGGNGKFVSTIGVSSGKFYMEIPWLGVANFGVGIAKTNTAQTYLGSGGNDLQFFLSGSSTALYSSNGVNAWDGSGTGWSNNDMLSLALDATNQIIAVYKNGSSIGSFDYSSLGYQLTFFGGGHSINGMIYLPNFGQNPTHSGTVTAGSATDGNGIGLFKYAPPSGYLSLCTKNLPDPAIPLPSVQFNTVLWAGNSTDDRAITVGFAADLTWFKQRTGTNSVALFDKVRGNSNPNGLSSNTTSQEFDWTGIFKGHTSTGFTVGTDSAVNANSNTYVAWNWKANGSGSTDTSGDIDAVVSANQAAGFSIITWTGDGGAHTTVPHGLGVAPEIIFEKYRNFDGHWYTWVTAIDGTNDYLLLNTTTAAGDAGASGTPTSQFFSNWGSPNGRNNVAYAFVSKPGFSKIGTYTGNGSADGPFVNCGFKPAWLMIKNTTNAQDWIIWDTKRDPFNEVTQFLYPNLNNAEAAGSNVVDLVSNGFKLRNAGTRNRNYNGDVYLFMAFAEAPFKYANARP